ncbi:MAG: methyltransferase domain-containing protein [Nitrospira sp.]|nr:methyltransferase domain-containing protein [Nitrospira sp.]MBS0174123.1 methyltransferase domain-containing protein [Nitrospira sp.]MCW5780024.1 methyltransferase domain-containing protein [Nitrospira sp.]HNA27151.1 methyltransferase [Nitrospira sp.]HNK14772.1 methyltransferase [Nitrospira sp.]
MPRELSLAEVFQLGYYWETKILLTAVKLDVFSLLDGQGRSAAELAKQLGADTRALELLLNALVAIRLLAKNETVYANTPVAQTHLVKHGPQYVGHLLLLHDAEWDNWGKLEEAIKTGRSPVSRHVFETDPALGANVLSVLHRIGQQSGPDLAKRLGLGQARTMLDLGGGAGTNAIAFCRVYPTLSATVFDLATTLPLTERTVKEAGLEGRIALKSGDFNRDSLEGPYDVVLMSDILHYQNLATNAALVKKIHAHLNPGGRLVIKDRFLDASGTSPAWTAAFAVHILVNTEQGGCYRTAEAMRWMHDGGYTSVEEIERTAVVQGFKPQAE